MCELFLQVSFYAKAKYQIYTHTFTDTNIYVERLECNRLTRSPRHWKSSNYETGENYNTLVGRCGPSPPLRCTRARFVGVRTYKTCERAAQKSCYYGISIKRQNSTVPLTKGRRITFVQSLEKVHSKDGKNYSSKTYSPTADTRPFDDSLPSTT